MKSNFLDNKQIQKIYKYDLFPIMLLSYLSGSFFFIRNLFTNYHVKKTIASVFGLNSRLKNSWKSFRHYCYDALFIYNLGWLLYGNINTIEKKLSKAVVKNSDALQKIISADSPTILLASHTGSYYIGLFAAHDRLKNKEIALLAPRQFEPERKQLMEERLKEVFTGGKNIKSVDLQDKFNLVEILGVLKKNGVIMCTCDFAFSFTKNKIQKFFGKEKEFPIGFIEMGLKFNANIVPMYNYRENHKYVVEFGEKLALVGSNEKERDILRYLNINTGRLESKISQIPEQYILWQTINIINGTNSSPLMNLELYGRQYTFCRHGGFYFENSYFSKNFNQKWFYSIKKYLPECFNLISDYVWMDRYPGIYFFSPDTLPDAGATAPVFAKAFTKEGNIYLLFNDKECGWKEIINKEMFYCGIFQFFNGIELLPEWLIRSISLYIGGESCIDSNLSDYISKNSSGVLNFLMKDTLISECVYSADVMKAFGYFLCEKYGKEKVKKLFTEVKQTQCFEKALLSVFDCDLSVLLDLCLLYINSDSLAKL